MCFCNEHCEKNLNVYRFQPSDVERLFSKYGHIVTCKIKDGYGFVVSEFLCKLILTFQDNDTSDFRNLSMSEMLRTPSGPWMGE